MQRKKRKILIAGILLALSLITTGCGSSSSNAGSKENSTQKTTLQAGETTGEAAGEKTSEATAKPVPIDYEKVKPNEAGKVMVVMFHQFVQSHTAKKGSGWEYITTFQDFRNLLPTLYDKGYRLVNLNDYLDNNITVKAGYKPMVFTFDDGTKGEFNLVEQNGALVVNPDSAVGIMEEFNRTHPDFGLKGTFYVNLGDKTFEGAGTLQQRLQYLIDKGFEIGNHTYSHINLKETKSAEKIQQEIGGNQKKMYELIPNYVMKTFSLPYGSPSKDLKAYVVKGEYEGVKYENKALMEVGANPNPSPVSKKFDPLSIDRVRASGIKPVECDLAWWLQKVSAKDEYVSDGDPNTVAVPKDKEELVDTQKLNGRKLVIYG